MNIFSFTAHFDSEEACRTHFKKERDEIGVVCKECGHTQHYWIKSRWSYECKNCRSRTSLRSGTIMQTRFAFLLIILTSISIYFGNAQSPGSSLFPQITDWKLSEPRIWGPHNLYTPINGAADMFLSYNFEEMQAADYSTDSNYISVEVYRHKTPIDAFGAYSQERPDRDIYSDIGVQAYSEDTYIHLLANRYYIKIRTANSDDKSRPAMERIAAQQVEMLNKGTSFPKEFAYFPKEGRVPFTERYINENIFGYSFLHSSYEVSYQLNDKSYVLFILQGSSDENARQMLQEYHKVLEIELINTKDGYYYIDDRYTGKIHILKSGKYLICARGDISKEASLEMLNKIKQGLD